VNRVTAAAYQGKDSVEPSYSAWYFQCCPGKQTEGTNSGYVRDEEPFEGFVVRNVQEDFNGWLSKFWHGLAFFAKREAWIYALGGPTYSSNTKD
jgi:hypothetical protein